MKIDIIKTKMINYRDFFGGDLLEVSDVKGATSKKELAHIIDSHYNHIEMMCNDAQHSLDRFRRELGLDNIEDE